MGARPAPRAHPTAHVCLCGGVAQGSSSTDPLPGVGGVDLEAGEVRFFLPARRPRARGPHPLLAPSRLLVRWRRTGIFLHRPAPGGGGRRPRGRRSAPFATRAPPSRAWPTPFVSALTSACAVASHRDLPPPTRSR